MRLCLLPAGRCLRPACLRCSTLLAHATRTWLPIAQVNTASRLESSGVAGCIHLSEETHRLVQSTPHFQFTERGKVEVSSCTYARPRSGRPLLSQGACAAMDGQPGVCETLFVPPSLLAPALQSNLNAAPWASSLQALSPYLSLLKPIP